MSQNLYIRAKRRGHVFKNFEGRDCLSGNCYLATYIIIILNFCIYGKLIFSLANDLVIAILKFLTLAYRIYARYICLVELGVVLLVDRIFYYGEVTVYVSF